MSAFKKTALAGMGTVVALAGVAGNVAVAVEMDDTADASEGIAVEAATDRSSEAVVKLNAVVGGFTFNQDEISSTEALRSMVSSASYLCGSVGKIANDDSTLPEEWTISVQGLVENPSLVTFNELTQDETVQKVILGCTCMGNPVDGRASVNAEVTGIPLKAILTSADVKKEANTIVFRSADGYEVALPLDYVTTRYATIVFDVNGASLAESVGGKNQLWLGATSANYFVRDVTSISLEQRGELPPNPSSDEARAAYQNLPNIGVLFGGEVR